MRAVCLLCLVITFAWCTKLALHPVWRGSFYNVNSTGFGSQGYYRGGVFALKGGAPAQVSAPIWDPPVPHADIIAAVVRWPWQPVTQHEHIEIVMSSLVMNWTFAIITMGAVLRTVWMLFARDTRNCCVTIWWSVTLSLTAGWIGLLILLVATLGFGVTDAALCVVPLVAAVVGVVVGVGRVVRSNRGATMAASAVSGPR